MELFIGPCVLESEALADEVASYIAERLKPFNDKLDIYFKGSFDKANRSSIDSYRGPGLEKGLQIFESIKKKYALKTITDFHYPEQAKEVASVVDIIQIPAFLCRQTDMVLAGAEACAAHNCKLNIKKGQFLAPEDTDNIVEKAMNYLQKDAIYLTERGTSFGYRNLVVDMASFQIMKSFGVKAIFDATHSVQRPGALGNATGGKREFIPVLAKAALAAGADGIFMEAHPNPDMAKSDAATQWPLNKVEELVKQLLAIKEVV